MNLLFVAITDLP